MGKLLFIYSVGPKVLHLEVGLTSLSFVFSPEVGIAREDSPTYPELLKTFSAVSPRKQAVFLVQLAPQWNLARLPSGPRQSILPGF